MDWSQYIAVNSATAHPHYDSEGATYNMGNSYGKSGNHTHCFVSVRQYVYVHARVLIVFYSTILFAVGPTQVSSTTSSACLLLTSSQRKRSAQTWLEQKWSAPSQLMSPGNPPTITASVRCCFMYSGKELLTVTHRLEVFFTDKVSHFFYALINCSFEFLLLSCSSFVSHSFLVFLLSFHYLLPFNSASVSHKSTLSTILCLKIYNMSRSTPSLLTLVFY